MHFKVLSSVLIIKEFRNNYIMVQLFVLIEVDSHVFIWNGCGGAQAHVMRPRWGRLLEVKH